jgi:hypothetical protein
MRFGADHSETLEVSLAAKDCISGHLYMSQSVVVKWRLCRNTLIVWDGFLRQNQSPRLKEITAHSSNILAPKFAKHNTTGFCCGVMSTAMCSEHQLTDLMT